MATQLLNAGADVVTIQQLLGHSKIEQTMRYSKLSNMKAQHDYYKAMDRVMKNDFLKWWVDPPRQESDAPTSMQ